MTARLALRIEPGPHTVEQVTSLLGVAPTRAQQDGPAASSWEFEVITDADDAIEAGIDELRPLFEQLADGDSLVAKRSLVLSLHTKPNGAMYELGVEHLRIIAAAGAEVVLDIYNGWDSGPMTVVHHPGDLLRALVSVVIRSEAQTAEQITELVGTTPSRVERKGDPVSRTEPDGPKRRRTTWTFRVEEHAPDPLPPGIERLRPLLQRLAQSAPQDELRFVFVMLYGDEAGPRYAIAADDIALMAEASVGLALDLYNEIDDE